MLDKCIHPLPVQKASAASEALCLAASINANGLNPRFGLQDAREYLMCGLRERAYTIASSCFAARTRSRSNVIRHTTSRLLLQCLDSCANRRWRSFVMISSNAVMIGSYD